MNSSHQRPYSPGNQQEMYYPVSASQQMQQQDFGGSAIQATTGCHAGLPMAFASPAQQQQQHIHRLPMGGAMVQSYPANYYHHPPQMGATADCFPQACNQGSVASGFITPVTNASPPVHAGGPLQGHLDHMDPRLCSQGSPVHYQGHVLYLQAGNMNNGQLSQPSRSSTIAYHLKQPANHFIHSASHPPTMSQSPVSSYCCPTQSQQSSQQTMLNGYIQQHTGQQLAQSPLRLNYNGPNMVGSPRVVDPSTTNYELIAINQACSGGGSGEGGEYGYSPHYECSSLRRTPISPSTINSPYHHQTLPDCNRLMQQQQQQQQQRYHHQRELHAAPLGEGGDNAMNNSGHIIHSQQQPGGEGQRTSAGASYDTSPSTVVQSTRELSRYQRAKLKNPYGSSLDALTRVMEIDEGDPLRKQFAERMKQIWIEYSIKLRTLPTITKIPIDLYMLYKLVRERNGYVEVTMKKQWREVANILGIFHIQSAAFGVKRNYTKLGILRYECLYDLNGVEQEQILRDVEASKPPPSNRKRKRPSKAAKLPMSMVGGDSINALDAMNDENTLDSPGSNSDSESPSVSRMSSGLLTNEDTPPVFIGCGSPCETSGYVYDKPWPSSLTDESSTPHLPSQRYAESNPPSSSSGPQSGVYSGMPPNCQDNAGEHSTSVINSMAYRELPNQVVITTGLPQSGAPMKENQEQTVSAEAAGEANKLSRPPHVDTAFPSVDSLVRPDEQGENAGEHLLFDRKFGCSTLSAALTGPGSVQYVTCSRSNASSPRLTSQTSPRMVYASIAPSLDNMQRQPRSALPTFRMPPQGLNSPTFSIVRSAMSQNHMSYQTVPQTLNTCPIADRKRSKVLTTVPMSSSAHAELVYNNAPVSFPDSHNAAILGSDFNSSSSPIMDVSGNGGQTIFIKTANRFIPAVANSTYVPGHNTVFVGNLRASNVARAFPSNQLVSNQVRSDQIYVNFKETVRLQAPPVVHHLPQCPPSDALALASVELSDFSPDDQLFGQASIAHSPLQESQELTAPEEKPCEIGGQEDVSCTAEVNEHFRIEELRRSMAKQQGRRRVQRTRLTESRISPRKLAMQLQSGLSYEVAHALGHINSLTCLPNEDSNIPGGDIPEMIDLTRYPTVICTLANVLARGVKASCLRNLFSSKSQHPFENGKLGTPSVAKESEQPQLPAVDRQSEDCGVKQADNCVFSTADKYVFPTADSLCDLYFSLPLDRVGSEWNGDALALSASLAIRNLSFVQKNRQMMARNSLLCQTLSQLLCATVALSDSECSINGIEGIGTRISAFGRFHREHHVCVTVRENVLITLSNIAEALNLSVMAEGKTQVCKVLFFLCQVQEPMQTEPLVCLNLLAIEIITKLLTFSLDNREYLHNLCQQQLADSLFETVARWLVSGAMLEGSSRHQANGRGQFELAGQSEALLAKAEMSVSLLLFLLDNGISDGCSQKVKSYFRPTDSVTCFRLMWALLLHLRQELQTPRPGAEKCALKCARAMFIVATHSKMIRERYNLQRESRSIKDKRNCLSPLKRENSDQVQDASNTTSNRTGSTGPDSQNNEGVIQTRNFDDQVVTASPPPDKSSCLVNEESTECENDTTNAGGDHEKSLKGDLDSEQMADCFRRIDQPNSTAENCTTLQNGTIDGGSEDMTSENLTDDHINDSTMSCAVPPWRIGSRMELRLKTRLVDTIFMVNCLTVGTGGTNSFYDWRQPFQSVSSLRRRKASSVAPVSMCMSSAQHQIAARIISMLSHCLRKLDPHR